MSWTFGYTNEITALLKEKRNEHFKYKKGSKLAEFEPYFMPPEKASLEEKQQYGTCAVVVFRSLGYTMGHVIINEKFEILDIKVYDRNKIQDYNDPAVFLEKELNEKFRGTTLILNEPKES